MARYVSEVAPPVLFVSSMRRHCISKVLDTIHEDETEIASYGNSFSVFVKRSQRLSSSTSALVSNTNKS